MAAYARAVGEARDYVVAHDIAGMPEGEELEVLATPAFLRSLLPFAAYDPPAPSRSGSSASTTSRRRRTASTAKTSPT